jgi:hypothetical protein
MIPSATVVAVDDDAAELGTIVGALRLLDVACLPILATAPAVDISSPLKGVRLVFFDINYLKGVTNEVSMFETAATVLTKVIAKDNGPYVIITWTSKSDQHGKLMKFLADNVPDVPAPAMTGFLQKEKFTADGAAKDGGASLREEILQVIAGHPQVEALMSWESAAGRAAGEVVCSLMDLFSRQDRFAAKVDSELHGILTHVAKEAVGALNVTSNRPGAIHEALVPMLFDRLIHGAPVAGQEELWERAITLAGDLPDTRSRHGAKLNTLSHIARPGSGPMNPGDRGVVFMVPAGAGALMAHRTAMDIQHVAGDFVTSKLKDQQPTLPDMAEVEGRCRWVFVGVRAICDQAQSKGVMRPLVLALEVPATLREGGVGLRLHNHGAISTTPIFSIPLVMGGREEQRRLIIDWHWTTSLSLTEMAGAEILYRVREPLISQISSQMAGYTARPGIITFD